MLRSLPFGRLSEARYGCSFQEPAKTLSHRFQGCIIKAVSALRIRQQGSHALLSLESYYLIVAGQCKANPDKQRRQGSGRDCGTTNVRLRVAAASASLPMALTHWETPSASCAALRLPLPPAVNRHNRRAGTLALRGGPSALFVGRASSHDSLHRAQQALRGEVSRSASRIPPQNVVASHTRTSLSFRRGGRGIWYHVAGRLGAYGSVAGF